MRWTSRLLSTLALATAATLGMSGHAADDEGWVSLFDGKTLDGWKVTAARPKYKVEDGAIVGTTVEGSPNTFLCKGDFKDFVLELEVRCDPRLNSGVQVRSHVYEKDDPPDRPEEPPEGGVVYGPQCEIARKETGTAGRFYDEGRRGKWLAEIKPEAEGRLQGRRLEPLPDRRAGQPLPLVGQRRRRLRLHRRRGPSRLHRPPGPRHRQGRGAVSGPLAEHPHPGVEAGREGPRDR